MRFGILVTYLFILSFVNPLHAKPIEPSNQPAALNAKAEISSDTNEEIKILRAELAATKAFHSSILDTVYWALGGTFVIAGLLLGFGWHANFKVYERDKIAMKAELDAGIALKLNEQDAGIAEKLKSIPELVANETKEIAKAQKKVYDAEFAELKSRLFAIELRYLKSMMETNPSDSMALTSALSVLRVCIDKATDEVPDIIHFMLKRIDKGGKLTATEITDVNQLLDKLPNHYNTLTEKLRAKLVASDIF